MFYAQVNKCPHSFYDSYNTLQETFSRGLKFLFYLQDSASFQNNYFPPWKDISVGLPEGSLPNSAQVFCVDTSFRACCAMQMLFICFQVLETRFPLTVLNGCLLLRRVNIARRGHLPFCQVGVLGFWMWCLPDFSTFSKVSFPVFPHTFLNLNEE